MYLVLFCRFSNRIQEIHQGLLSQSFSLASSLISDTPACLKHFVPDLVSTLQAIREFRQIDPAVVELISTEPFDEFFQTVHRVAMSGSNRLKEFFSKTAISMPEVKTQVERNDSIDLIDEVAFIDEEMSRGRIKITVKV